MPGPTEARSTASPRRSSGNTHTDLPQRTTSSTSRSGTSAHPARAESYSQSHSQQVSTSSRLGNLARMTSRDYEQSNLAQTPPPRSNTSREGTNEGSATYSENARSSRRTSSRPDPSRYASDGPQSSHTATNGSNRLDPTRTQSSTIAVPRRRTTVTAQTGQWALGKTIGQGSMGKVKLARNLETGEQVCLLNSC